MEENGFHYFHQLKYGLSLKNVYTKISDGFHLQEKLWTKENVSISQKICFH